jgi:hypothetical protein
VASNVPVDLKATLDVSNVYATESRALGDSDIRAGSWSVATPDRPVTDSDIEDQA